MNNRGHYGIDVSNYFSIVSKNAIIFFPLARNYLFWYIIYEWYYGATSLIRHLCYPTLMVIPIWPLMTMQFFLTHNSSTSIFQIKHVADSYLSQGPNTTTCCFSVFRRVKNSSNTSMCVEYVLRTFFTSLKDA